MARAGGQSRASPYRAPGPFMGVVAAGPSPPRDGNSCSFLTAHLYPQSWALSTTLAPRSGFRPTWVPALLLPLKPFFSCENSSLSEGGLQREVAMCVWWSCFQVAAPRLRCHLRCRTGWCLWGLPWGKLKLQWCLALRAVLPGGIPKPCEQKLKRECVCVCMHSSGKHEGHVYVASDSSGVTGAVSSGGFAPVWLICLAEILRHQS